ncbi:MAG: TonB-dependent receptor, partial [Endomicrobium sp.]|nr:TonB-dependent receptor [Endomicrobium sp.]
MKKAGSVKKVAAVVLAVLLLSGAGSSFVLAEDVFLSLTKYEANTEKLPTNITVITKEEIAEKNFSTLAELLQNETGVNVRRNGTVGAAESVLIRGASSLQTLVLIDGRRINDIGLGSADFTAVPAAAIEKVEIIRGAGAAVYGSGAFGGIINVITKKASQSSPIIDAKISYGSFNTFEPSLAIARSGERFNVLAALSNISTDGDRENSEFVNYDVFLSAQYKIDDKSALSLTENIYDGKYGVAGSLSWLTPKNEQKDKNKYVKIDYDLNFEDFGDLTVSGYASNNTRYFYDATGNPYDPSFLLTQAHYKYFSDTFGALADFHYKDIFLAGAEYWGEYYKEDEELSGYKSKRNRENAAAYAQLNLSFGNFTFIPGARYDDNSQYGGYATPSISAVF